MVKLPLPFVIAKKGIPKPEKKQMARQWWKATRMTLVAALSDFEGVVFFADDQEVIGGYSKKSIQKISVVELTGHPFRFAIGSATEDGPLTDMLEKELTSTLAAIETYDLQIVREELAKTLTEFHSKHLWPRPDRPKMEHLIVIQPIPEGMPQIIHIEGTAPSVLEHIRSRKSIGIGAYLADYLFHRLLGGGAFLNEGDSLAQLVSAAAHVSHEVHTNISEVGPLNRIVQFDNHGNWDEFWATDIRALEENLTNIREIDSMLFAYVTDISGSPKDQDYSLHKRSGGVLNVP